MTGIEETEEYKRGRNGELLIHSFAIEHGCITFDVAGTAHGKAPLFSSRKRHIIAPDAMHIRHILTGNEYKTKTHAFEWRGGSRDMVDKIPPCLMQGVDCRSFLDLKVINLTVPVLLWFLTISTGELHVAALDQLGAPLPSVSERYPMVNFPLSRMFLVVTFDTERLWRYFSKDRRHAALPNADERKRLLEWLRPRQLEFDAFTEHFLTWHESLVKR